MIGLLAAVHEFGSGSSRTSGEVRVESAKRGIADIASSLRPNRFMSTRPNVVTGVVEQNRRQIASINRRQAERGAVIAR